MRKTIFLTLFLSAVSLQAQDNKTIFDDKLAKSLGADEHGMKNYIFVILSTGEKTVTDKNELGEIFAGHMKNINRLAAEGKLLLAGPFGSNANGYRGLFIINAATIEDAQALTATDPAVKAGVLKAEFYPWYGTAALGEIPKLHEKIAKNKF